MIRYVDLLYPVNVEISINSISHNAFAADAIPIIPNTIIHFYGLASFLVRNEPALLLLPAIFLSRDSYLAEYHNTRNNARPLLTLNTARYAANIVHTYG